MSDILKYSFLFSMILSACAGEESEVPFFPGSDPGKAGGDIQHDSYLLYNNALKAEWIIEDNSLRLKEVTNKYDGQKLVLGEVQLFVVETVEGKRYSSTDFRLTSEPELSLLKVSDSDSYHKGADVFTGKEISAGMISADNAVHISWRAQLSDGSNYLRQNVEISPGVDPVKITRVTLFDGRLEGAEYAGMVLGSPVKCRNFFFAFEHPIAHSKALLSRQIGSVSDSLTDVSEIIDSAGEYIISVELGGGSTSFDLGSVSLEENGQILSTDSHSLTGKGGSNIYRLGLAEYHRGSQYRIRSSIVDHKQADGTLFIHRTKKDLLNFYVDRQDILQPGNKISEWSVIGVSPPGQARRAFQYYLERERARPYRQFLHYNCWWDITTDGASSFTSGQLISRINEWNAKFIKPFGVKLNSFVFDDGWDNTDSVWYFDPVKFPQGFKQQALLSEKYGSGIGVWMSPFGGYGENKRKRVEAARREGLETNGKGLSLAGAAYFNRFLDRASDMVDSYNVNYFKFDGFGGSEPQYLPDMEAGTRLIGILRQHNPDLFINITVGSWPSPFWLKYADCTWRGSGDMLMAGKGTRTSRFMTYRDGTLFNNVVKKAPYYPLNSIMVVGIAYANQGWPRICINDSISDFRDMVWSFLAAGSALQELYISPDRMKDDFWPVLAKAAKWVKSNERILYDTHWIGGSPINMDVYGFASWTPEKGIIIVRNPDDTVRNFDIDLREVLELPERFQGNFRMMDVNWGDPVRIDGAISSSEIRRLELKPFEIKLMEVYPVR